MTVETTLQDMYDEFPTLFTKLCKDDDPKKEKQ